MDMPKWIATGIAAAAILPLAQAEVKMPEVFSSHMVLQRDAAIPVWGWADPGETVTVSIAGLQKSTTADPKGNWQVDLPPMQPGAPLQLSVKGNNALVFEDILVGDVWLCSGQSNMEWRLSNTDNAAEEIAAAKHPTIRLFHVQRSWKSVPQRNLEATWKPCTPETVPSFSAVGYFFGRELTQSLNVPIGLINSSWGGTRIEPWTPPTGFQQIKELESIAQQVELKDPASAVRKAALKRSIDQYNRWIQQAEASIANSTLVQAPPAFPQELLDYTSHQQPTVLYNAMIHPLLPLPIKGAIWYQGESNRGDGMDYADKMRALIAGWRSVWNNPELPFYFVQLAPYDYRSAPYLLPTIWQAQQQVAKTVPHTGMAVINDIGNVKDIHPRNKRDVGLRLAKQALNKTYGKIEIVCEAPVFQEMEIQADKVRITFDHARSLKTRDGKAPDWFEISGEDGIYKKADATIDGTAVVLSEASISKPCAVRFAWHMLAEPNLTNEAGLPASAFKAGSIPEAAAVTSRVPEAKGFQAIYELDPSKPQASSTSITYTADKSQTIDGQIEQIAYFLLLNDKDYVFVSMDPFTQDLKQVGVPTKDSGAFFQTKINNLFVKSNMDDIKNGHFPEGGNIEFWPSNYGGQNSAQVPGASGSTFDFGDGGADTGAGYGSMQVHNYSAKQTLFAFNNWKSGKDADLGIGNQKSGNPDWTFARNAGKYTSAKLVVLVKTK